jgi:hypothetical protein
MNRSGEIVKKVTIMTKTHGRPYTLLRGDFITPRVLEWLRTFAAARVLHRSNGACNLVDGRSEVISLVSPRVGPGPFAVVLSDELPLGALSPDAAVLYDATRRVLTIGPVSVDLHRAVVWQPTPDWSRLRGSDPAVWPHGRPPAELRESLERVVRAIALGDRDECRVGVLGLAGRGTGLTPAGDDVLVGVLFALWVWQPAGEWRDLIRDTAAPRTTTLSAAFIRAAAAGEAVRAWHRLVAQEPEAVADILSIGHTSGADAWAGFYHASMALAPISSRSSRRENY